MDIGIKLLPVMWVFLCIPRHVPTEVQQWHKHTVLCISLSKLVSCAFSTIPICPFLYLLVSTVFSPCITPSKIEFPMFRGEYNL